VPAILTGQLPSSGDRVPVAAEHPHNLFTLLGGRYHLNVRESVTRLCPRTSCAAQNRALGVHPGVRGMLRDTAKIWGDFADPANRAGPGFGGLGGEDVQAMLTANGFLNSLGPSTGPQLDFLHVLLPHFPWHYLPTGQDYAALPAHTNGLHGQNWANGQVAALARVRHLLQVQATDTFIGRVVERLRAIGEWDNTLLVLTADHGVSFAPGGPIRGVTKTNAADIAWTPLLIKAPGQTAGGVDDRPAESIDVLPTIASHLGVTIPWSVDGRSLTGPARSARQARTFPMFDWSRSTVHPPSGESFLHLDRAAAWAQVQQAQAAPPNDFADLRVFGTGIDDDLLGAPLTGRVGPPVPDADVTLDGPLRYLAVDQTQAKTPFAAIHGVLGGVDPGTRLAIVVNGVVAGLSAAYRAPGADQVEFWGTLVPRLFHTGRNLVQVFSVDGPPGGPVAHLIAPKAAPSG
ncbi:MAG: sulfatase-like hydrolase/transferase, partial [Acidimicrobiia bacterium]|nr:sulfatase-like hydrolase/transferase [Acidimicrobiia bacterium]